MNHFFFFYFTTYEMWYQSYPYRNKIPKLGGDVVNLLREIDKSLCDTININGWTWSTTATFTFNEPIVVTNFCTHTSVTMAAEVAATYAQLLLEFRAAKSLNTQFQCGRKDFEMYNWLLTFSFIIIKHEHKPSHSIA